MKKLSIIYILLVGSTAFAQRHEVEPDPECDPSTELCQEVQQQNFEQTMVASFKSGNATAIAGYFGANVDLSIQGKENLYSNKQGEQVLKNFFITNKPSDFVIIHKGKSGQSEYFIGELSTANGSFRVTINSKNGGASGKEITSLTIEEN